MNRSINTFSPALCVALSGITFGTIGYFGVRLFQGGFLAHHMLFWRFLLASIFIFPFIKGYSSHTAISLKGLISCFFLGGIFYGLSTYCFFSSIPYIGSGVAMVIFYAFPVLVAFLSWGIDKKKLTAFETLAMCLIFPGIVLLSVTDTLEFDVYGIWIAIGSAFFYGIYFYASKRVSKNTPPLLASFMICLGNTFFFFLVCLYERDFRVPQTQYHWFQYVGFSFLGTVLPLWLLFIGLKKTNVTKAALISVLEPLSTVIIGIWILEETLSNQQIFGMVILLFAAIIVQFKESEMEVMK